MKLNSHWVGGVVGLICAIYSLSDVTAIAAAFSAFGGLSIVIYTWWHIISRNYHTWKRNKDTNN